jgi:hypothetical protein
MPVITRKCKLFDETFLDHANLAKRIFAFLDHKNNNPLQPFGSSDSGFTPDGPIGKLGLNIKHAHVSQDVSIIYRVHGNPQVMDLYGVFSHKESGTGNAANIRIQQQLATRLSNQDFPELPKAEPAQQNNKNNKKRR